MQRLKSTKKETPSTRDHWEDPQRSFSEWATTRDWQKNVFGRVLLEVEERLSLRRACLIFLFCLGLSFLVFFQLRVPTELIIGQPAPIDFVSPLTFDMVDEVTTEDKRVKAQSGITDIYDYDSDVYGRIVTAIDRAFRNMRAYGREVKWPNSVLRRAETLRPFLAQKAVFEKELQTEVSDDLYEWLVDNRFSPRIENALIRALEIWYERKIAEMPERKIAPLDEITARTLNRKGAGAEAKIRATDVMDLRNPENFVFEDRRSLDRFDEADRAHLLRLARSLVQSNLTLNKAETAARKQTARDEVLPVNISIRKSQTIVGRGSTVQPFHMAIVKEIEIRQAERRRGLMAVALSILLATSILVYASFQRRYGLQKLKLQGKDLAVMMSLIVAQVFFTKLFLFIMDAAFLDGSQELLSADFFRALAPVAAAPMLVGLLIGRGEVVWFFTAFTAITLGVMEDFHFGFFLQALLTGVAAARGVHNCKKRNDIYMAGLRAGAVNAIVLASIHLITRGDHEGLSGTAFFLVIVGGFAGGILSSLITMMIVPLLESVFRYTTDVKLLELSNLNHPLLKEMIVKAPGTYHHSMMVGSMVEAAAEEIGANPLLGKVMSYYHDIGKLEHAKYFIENQRPGTNPHDNISPFMSKTLLVAHVKDGVEMGMQHKLGQPIIDGILQHHGTTLISYFYHKAVEQRQDGDPEISEDDFRYPGPKPQFKEAALCMLADSIEAAARSLDEPTPARLQSLVRNIIQKKFTDGQLDECNLTLKEIAKIEKAFIRILLGIYHQRIDYPRGVS